MRTPFLLFLLSPFIGLIQGFKHHKEAWAKNSIWLFVIFYGFTMFRPEEMDSNRYAEKLIYLHGAPVNWDTFIANFYSDDGTTLDIYQSLITYILSLVTDSGNILFAVFGIIFGYFFSRNIWFLFESLKDRKMDAGLWLLMFTFICVIGFWELNGVRMWTAAHIFFYGAFLFIVKGNKKGFLIAALSILVHFSFIMPLAVLAFFYFVKLPWRLLYFGYIASFFVSELNIHFISDFLESHAPEFLLPKVKSYTSDEYLETLNEAPAINWYVIYYVKSLGWVIFLMISSVYFSSLGSIRSNKAFSNLFGFTLLFLSVGNLMSLLPSGSRYLIIARLFAVALLFLIYVWYNNKTYKRQILLLSPLLAFFIIVSVRISFETTTFVTVIANPVIALFIDIPVPLITLFK